jgi:hypothetical protein
VLGVVMPGKLFLLVGMVYMVLKMEAIKCYDLP